MLEELNKKKQERGQCAETMKALVDTAEKENRDMTSEESANFDAAYKRQSELKKEIDTIMKEFRSKNDREAQLHEVEKELRDGKPASPIVSAQGLVAIKGGDKETRDATAEKELRMMSLFNKILLGEQSGADLKEYRDLQVTQPTKGGYLVAPIKMAQELIKDLDKEVMFRRYARVLPPLTDAVSLGYPTMPSKMTSFAWGTELTVASEDTTMKFGRREFKPNPYSTFCKVSADLLRFSSMSPDGIVRDEQRRVTDENQEIAFISGDGDKKPLGLFAVSPQGLTAAVDVSTDNTSSDVTFDGLKNAKYSLKPGYRKSAKMAWLAHSDFVLKCSKKKDNDGQYIWQQSVVAGDPDKLLGYDILESEFAPNTFSTGQYVAVLGDFSHYWIVDVHLLEIQVLTELFAMSNEIGYKGRGFTDGMPVKEEAFRRVKLA